VLNVAASEGRYRWYRPRHRHWAMFSEMKNRCEEYSYPKGVPMFGLISLILGGVSFGGGHPIWGVCWIIAGLVLLSRGA
jgi:hypothetical protein